MPTANGYTNRGARHLPIRFHPLRCVLKVISGAFSREDRVKQSYGGVLFDAHDRVLLRKPAGEFDGYVWTFAKGTLEAGSTPEDTALREVAEETGIDARIVGKVPGEFAGSTSVNRYYIMVPAGPPKAFGWETAEVRWVQAEDAVALIGQTRNKQGRDRDLAVLQVACEEWALLKAAQ
jgi:8-oxo-dGTP pyrophosphatase MutT (NUDIX family)